MKTIVKTLALISPMWIFASTQTAFAQSGSPLIPPGSGGFFSRNYQFGDPTGNQNGNGQLLQQLQLQQQRFFNQQRVQQSLSNNARVSTTGHPVLFNDTGGYFGDGTNGGNSGVSTPSTPFFNPANRPNIFGGGSNFNFLIGIR